MEEIIVHITENNVSFVDYLPYIISILSIISTLIITTIQLRHNYKLHKRNSTYDIKKEAIFEALNFLDTYISWLDMDSGFVPEREYVDKTNLTIQARKIYNKLCVTCNNKKIVKIFVDIITDLKCKQKYNIFEKYNEFRNECRKELGFDKVELPKDKVFISSVNTRALNEYSKNLYKGE